MKTDRELGAIYLKDVTMDPDNYYIFKYGWDSAIAHGETRPGALSEERKRIWKLIENSKLADSVKDNERFAFYEFALQELKSQIFFGEDEE